MMPDEKVQLLALLADADCWCQNAEAQNGNGDPVHYDDASAVAWDITGALCRLLGWERAAVLFGQFDRHIHGKRKSFGWPQTDDVMIAMVGLQEFNDRPDTTFSQLRELVESMPVWRGGEGDSASIPVS